MPDFVRARCRLIPTFWVVIAVCLAMMLLFAGMAIAQPPRDLNGLSAFIAMLALWGAIPFYWLVARLRGAIEFDENGVRWRTAFGAWKSARWDEIDSADMRTTSTDSRIHHWTFVVTTRKGQFSWTSQFENAEQLAPFGARFCPLIDANTDAWPRLFTYQGGENLFFRLASLCLIGGFAWGVFNVVGKTQWGQIATQIYIYFELYGWPLTIAGFALFAMMVLAIPALFSLACLSMALNGWRRRGENFVATTRGLSWNVNGNQRLFAAWDELQTFRVEARRRLIALPFYRLQSARGEFRWNNELRGNSQLARTLFERAPQLETVVQMRLREELGEAQDEQGEVLIFNYKTRSLRAMLWFGPVLSLCLWGATIFGPFEPANGSEPMPTWASFVFAVIVTAATLYGIQFFRRGCIRLDERGIAWDLPFRKRFIAWEEIEELRLEKGLPLIVGKRKISLCGPPIAPAHVERLLEIVALRAVNAGGEWKRADKIARG